jgi:hypothetical protein
MANHQSIGVTWYANGNWQEKKESKDVADIETGRTQKRFPCMSHCPAFGINFTSLSFTHSSLANQDSEETLNRALHGA